MAAAQRHQQIQMFNILFIESDKCIQLLRKLRAKVLRGQEVAFSLDYSKSADERAQLLTLLETVSKEMSDLYDQLETQSKLLPQSGFPPADCMHRMRDIFQEEQLNLSAAQLIEDMIDSANYNEANGNIYLYLHLLSQGRRPHPSSSLIPKPLVWSNWSMNNSPHNMFINAFYSVERELKQKNSGIAVRFLEKSTMSSIVEAVYFVVSDKQTIYTQKLLLLENCGQIEMIQMIAPHEDWTFYEEMGRKRVDLTKQSRYYVYQKLSQQANFQLLQFFTLSMLGDPRQNHIFINQCLTSFGKLQMLFETHCKACKKVMKDFLPPLMFDLRSSSNLKNSALHENCK